MSRGLLPLPRSHMPRHGCGSLRQDDDGGLGKGRCFLLGIAGILGVAWRGGLIMGMVRGGVFFFLQCPYLGSTVFVLSWRCSREWFWVFFFVWEMDGQGKG